MKPVPCPVATGDVYWRYYSVIIGEQFPSAHVEAEQFSVFRVTDECFWIRGQCIYKKRMKKNAKRPWAFPSRREALASFVRRKECEISHLERKAVNANLARVRAREMQEEWK